MAFSMSEFASMGFDEAASHVHGGVHGGAQPPSLGMAPALAQPTHFTRRAPPTARLASPAAVNHRAPPSARPPTVDSLHRQPSTVRRAYNPDDYMLPPSSAHVRLEDVLAPAAAASDGGDYEKLLQLDENVPRRGLSQHARSALATTRAAGDDVGMQDPITKRRVRAGDRLVRLPCGHCAIAEGADRWFEQHRTCPVCRFELEA